MIEPLGHQVALMILETTAAVKFNGAVSMIDLQMERLRAMFTGGSFRKIKKLGANSLPAMSRFDEELVDPSTFAAVLQAEVEADDQVGNGSARIDRQKNQTKLGLVEKFDQILADDQFVKGLGPRIVLLHMAHQEEQGIKIGQSTRANGERDWQGDSLSKCRST